MIRRYLFLGLMVALVAAIVSLVVSGRKAEKAAAKIIPHEIIRTSPATAVRLLAPPELSVTDRGPEAALEIRNSGEVPFRGALLKILYYDHAGRVLETRDVVVNQSIAPGETVAVEASVSGAAPEGSARRSVRVAYGETSSR